MPILSFQSRRCFFIELQILVFRDEVRRALSASFALSLLAGCSPKGGDWTKGCVHKKIFHNIKNSVHIPPLSLSITSSNLSNIQSDSIDFSFIQSQEVSSKYCRKKSTTVIYWCHPEVACPMVRGSSLRSEHLTMTCRPSKDGTFTLLMITDLLKLCLSD